MAKSVKAGSLWRLILGQSAHQRARRWVPVAREGARFARAAGAFVPGLGRVARRIEQTVDLFNKAERLFGAVRGLRQGRRVGRRTPTQAVRPPRRPPPAGPAARAAARRVGPTGSPTPTPQPARQLPGPPTAPSQPPRRPPPAGPAAQQAARRIPSAGSAPAPGSSPRTPPGRSLPTSPQGGEEASAPAPLLSDAERAELRRKFGPAGAAEIERRLGGQAETADPATHRAERSFPSSSRRVGAFGDDGPGQAEARGPLLGGERLNELKDSIDALKDEIKRLADNLGTRKQAPDEPTLPREEESEAPSAGRALQTAAANTAAAEPISADSDMEFARGLGNVLSTVAEIAAAIA